MNERRNSYVFERFDSAARRHNALVNWKGTHDERERSRWFSSGWFRKWLLVDSATLAETGLDASEIRGKK